MPKEEYKTVKVCTQVCKPYTYTVQVPCLPDRVLHDLQGRVLHDLPAWCRSTCVRHETRTRCYTVPEEKVRQVPYTTCRMVPEQHVRYETRKQCYTVPEEKVCYRPVHDLPDGPRARTSATRPGRHCYTVCEEKVCHIPYTTCRIDAGVHYRCETRQHCYTVCEQHVKNVPYTTCRMVPEQHVRYETRKRTATR